MKPHRITQKPLLDLTINQKIYRYGDITAHLTWTWDDGRPCIVLVPTHVRTSHERITPCVVRIREGWIWTEEVGDARHCARTSAAFAACLGFSPHDTSTLIAVTAVVRDCLDEMMQMPPLPHAPETRKSVAHMEIHDHNTGKTTHKEVTDHV